MLYLRGMIQEEFGCDYPFCTDHFDQTNGASIAILKNGQVLAFCAEHAQLLRQSGVALKTLSEVHKEKRGGKTTQEEKWEKENQAYTNAFIEDLKTL